MQLKRSAVKSSVVEDDGAGESDRHHWSTREATSGRAPSLSGSIRSDHETVKLCVLIGSVGFLLDLSRKAGYNSCKMKLMLCLVKGAGEAWVTSCEVGQCSDSDV